jgi:hypothetical protein
MAGYGERELWRYADHLKATMLKAVHTLLHTITPYETQT